jgi:hypothetical protein
VLALTALHLVVIYQRLQEKKLEMATKLGRFSRILVGISGNGRSRLAFSDVPGKLENGS